MLRVQVNPKNLSAPKKPLHIIVIVIIVIIIVIAVIIVIPINTHPSPMKVG